MNALQKAKALGIDNEELSDIIVKLQAITAVPISLTYLMEMLNFRGMLRKTDGSAGQERWVGTLQNLKGVLVAMGMTDKVSAYEMWFSHVTNPRQSYWNTTIPDFAVAFAEMQEAFAGGEGMPSVEDFEAVVALGGGRPYVDLSEDEYEQLKKDFDDEVTARDLRDEQSSRFATIMNEYINPNTDDKTKLIDGLRQAISYLEGL